VELPFLLVDADYHFVDTLDALGRHGRRGDVPGFVGSHARAVD
jgi:hypothetical protein